MVDGNWHRVKIKSPKYVAMHHTATGGEPSAKRIVNMILSGEDIEYLAYCPQYESKFAEYRNNIYRVKEYITDECDRYIKIWKKCDSDRKAFAIAIKNEKTKGLGFSVASGKKADDIFLSLSQASLMRLIDEENT